MPLYPGSATSVGLGLWNSRAGTMLVESAMFVAGIWIYARTTRARDRVGAIAWWAMVVLLVALYTSTAFGPPPPSVKAIIVFGFNGGMIRVESIRGSFSAQALSARTESVMDFSDGAPGARP